MEEGLAAVTHHTTLHAIGLIGQTMTPGLTVAGNSDLTVLLGRRTLIGM